MKLLTAVASTVSPCISTRIFCSLRGTANLLASQGAVSSLFDASNSSNSSGSQDLKRKGLGVRSLLCPVPKRSHSFPDVGALFLGLASPDHLPSSLPTLLLCSLCHNYTLLPCTWNKQTPIHPLGSSLLCPFLQEVSSNLVFHRPQDWDYLPLSPSLEIPSQSLECSLQNQFQVQVAVQVACFYSDPAA